MKKIDERILGNEVFVAEEHRLWEFAHMDVATDSGDVLVKEFGDLLDRIEVEVDSHFSPMNFLIL